MAISSRFCGSKRRCLGHLAGTAALCVTGPLAAGAGAILLRHGPALAQERPGSAPVEIAFGSHDAPITVVEYFSFSCSHCARFHRETYPELKRDYIETGKISFVVRDFPLNLSALTAAALARCIGPERYFDTIDVIWTRWDDWINEAQTAPAAKNTSAKVPMNSQMYFRQASVPIITVLSFCIKLPSGSGLSWVCILLEV